MRILYLCKRHYMNHDVIEDRYARLYEQPFQLSQLGNDVLGVCLSYRPCEKKNESHTGGQGSIQWVGYSSGRLRTSLLFYPSKLLALARAFKPDLIVGSSDCLHVALAQWLANKIGCLFSADLYDDYESFGLAKLPFLKYFYRRALKKTRTISCVSQSLANHIRLLVGNKPTILALPSTIDKDVFHPMNKEYARKSFNLPNNKILIGTAGGLTKEKGIETVYRAVLICIEKNPNVHFAVAGPIDKRCPPPVHERIHYLGKLPHKKVAELFCSLDVGIVYLRDTLYGKLSFPQKAYEMASCRIPMIVADIGDMSFLFSRSKNELYTADDAVDLANALQHQLEHPNRPALEIDDWHEHGKKLNHLYLTSL